MKKLYVIFQKTLFTLMLFGTAFLSYNNNIAHIISNFNIFIKLIIVAICSFAVTLINKGNTKFCIIITAVVLNITTIAGCVKVYIMRSSNTFFWPWWIIVIIAAILGIITAILINIQKLNDKSRNIAFRAIIFSFVPIYIVLLIFCFLRVPNSGRTLNFVPLADIKWYINSIFYRNYEWPNTIFLFVGNIVITIPYPIILKTIFPKVKKGIIIALSVLFPFFIEGYQFIFKCGNISTDDIILNLIGIATGLLLYRLYCKRIKCH